MHAKLAFFLTITTKKEKKKNGQILHRNPLPFALHRHITQYIYGLQATCNNNNNSISVQFSISQHHVCFIHFLFRLQTNEHVLYKFGTNENEIM